MLINTLDAKTTYGFTLDSAPSWLDTPNTDTPSAKVLRRGGATVLDNPRDQVRSVTLRGTVTGTTAQDARDKIDALKLALRKNTGAQLTFDDLSTRFIIARLQSFRVPPFGPSMIQRKLSVEIVLTAYDPYSYDNALTTVNFAAGIAAFTLGTGPSRPLITITGAVVNPLILYADGVVVLASLQLTVTNIAGDTLLIDMDAKTIKKNGINNLSLITSGDFFTLDQLISLNANGTYVQVSPSATGSISYRKSWR